MSPPSLKNVPLGQLWHYRCPWSSIFSMALFTCPGLSKFFSPWGEVDEWKQSLHLLIQWQWATQQLSETLAIIWVKYVVHYGVNHRVQKRKIDAKEKVRAWYFADGENADVVHNMIRYPHEIKCNNYDYKHTGNLLVCFCSTLNYISC